MMVQLEAVPLGNSGHDVHLAKVVLVCIWQKWSWCAFGNKDMMVQLEAVL